MLSSLNDTRLLFCKYNFLKRIFSVEVLSVSSRSCQKDVRLSTGLVNQAYISSTPFYHLFTLNCCKKGFNSRKTHPLEVVTKQTCTSG